MKIVAGILATLLFASPALAQGQKVGFGEEEQATQGSGGKENTNANPENEGQTVTETTGPRGQLKNDRTDCNNCTTTVTDEPGKAN
jgi:uncharacterized protein YdeI (BOF family)